MNTSKVSERVDEAVEIALRGYTLPGRLTVPRAARGLVVLAVEPRSSKHPSEREVVAKRLVDAGLGALALDLFPDAEVRSGDESLDVDVVAVRLLLATRWLSEHLRGRGQCVGYFGTRRGATAVLLAAAEDPGIAAVVAHDGRPELAESRLAALRAPTMLIVGSTDREVLGANERASRALRCRHEIVVDVETTTEPLVAGHERIARRAMSWFVGHLVGDRAEGERR